MVDDKAVEEGNGQIKGRRGGNRLWKRGRDNIKDYTRGLCVCGVCMCVCMCGVCVSKNVGWKIMD
jgi:hypothetical protein